MQRHVAIVGTGPAALMVADLVSAAGHRVSLFEKKKGPGRKLLIAGSSGLNITNSLPLKEFLKNYSGNAPLTAQTANPGFWHSLLEDFSPQDWIHWIEGLGLSTFEGTSGRYFVKDMKASKLLRSWLNRLTERGVRFYYGTECVGFKSNPVSLKIKLEMNSEQQEAIDDFDAICFCLGGASYEPKENPLRWPLLFTEKGLGFTPFTPSNVGYQVAWTQSFLKECEGQPLKNIRLTSKKGTRLGDAVITSYGVEGTPVYSVGQVGTNFIDLKPDLTLEQALKKCLSVKENLSPMRRVKKQLGLCPAALALLFHFTPKADATQLSPLIARLKNFPIDFIQSQSLDEAISSSGGLHLTELSEGLMIQKYPGVFAAGEMLDWDAPTGGFLIQGCVSQGHRAGLGILNYLAKIRF